MALDKTEIVALTLETQAVKAEERGNAADRLSAGHQGARDVIKAIESSLKAITPQAEAEIMELEELTDEAKVVTLKQVARAMMRVAHVLAGAHANQQNLIYLKQGEAKAHHDMAIDLRNQARVRRDGERAKAESIAMGEANRAAAEAVKPAPAKKPRKRKAKLKPNGQATPANGAKEAH